MRTRR